MISADTNLFIYAYVQGNSAYESSRAFFADHRENLDFAICDLVLVEVYMQLRNPAVVKMPLSARDAVAYCRALSEHPRWQYLRYNADIMPALWDFAGKENTAFRRIIDARLALTLRHYGVTRFATANEKDFQNFGFEKVWNPVKGE